MDHPNPSTVEPAGAHEGLPPATRRAFLKASALAAGPAALLAASAARGQGTGSGGGAGYRLPDLYPGWNKRNFQQIQADENAHAAYLQATLGANALPPLALNFAAMTIPANAPILFASYASVIESTETGTYLALGNLIYDKGVFVAASSILGIECYHAGYLNPLVDFPIVKGGEEFLQPFTLAQTLQNLSPFFADPTQVAALAGAISTMPSPANDVAILNFSLAAERFGSTFYNINVPRFFA